MAPEELEYGDFQYRSQGGEVQRRPKNREGLSAWDAAWLVLHKDETDESKMVPSVVLSHFKQAKDSRANNFGRV